MWFWMTEHLGEQAPAWDVPPGQILVVDIKKFYQCWPTGQHRGINHGCTGVGHKQQNDKVSDLSHQKRPKMTHGCTKRHLRQSST